jgi:hypothetical protein
MPVFSIIVKMIAHEKIAKNHPGFTCINLCIFMGHVCKSA